MMKGLRNLKWGQIAGGVLLLCFGVYHSGQMVVREYDQIHEQFFFFKLRSADYDAQLAAYNIGGYDKCFHDLSEYPCFEYCNHFLTREYQVGKLRTFVVYKGMGPLFTLGKDEWTPQRSCE